MKPSKLIPFILAAAALWLAFGPSLPTIPWPVIGSPPPFKADKLSVLVVEESAHRGQYTGTQLDVLQSTDANAVATIVRASGGQFQVIDLDTASSLQNAPPWVKEAMNVKRDSHPWIVAATPRSGFSVPLTTESDALARIGGLK